MLYQDLICRLVREFDPLVHANLGDVVRLVTSDEPKRPAGRPKKVRTARTTETEEAKNAVTLTHGRNVEPGPQTPDGWGPPAKVRLPKTRVEVKPIQGMKEKADADVDAGTATPVF